MTGNSDVIEPCLDQQIYYYDVKGEDVKKWFESAVKMQNSYVRDQKESDYFTYKPEERFHLLIRICMNVFGWRDSSDGPVGLGGYNMIEVKEATKIKRKLIEVAGGTKKTVVNMNVSYLSTFTYLKKEFHVTEIPVFVVQSKDGSVRFVDTTCSTFTSVQEAIQSIGSRFKGGIMYPRSLRYKPEQREGLIISEGEQTVHVENNGPEKKKPKTEDKIILDYTESSGSSLANRALDTIETTIAFASIVLGVASVAVSLPLGAYVQAVGRWAQIGAIYAGTASTALTLTKVAMDMGRCYRYGRFEEASDKVIFLLSMALSTATSSLRMRLNATVTLGDVASMYGGWYKTVLYTLRATTTITTFLSITQSIYALYKKKTWTFGDCYQLATSSFALYNVIISPYSIEAILESEQMKFMEQIEAELKNDREAKNEFDLILNENQGLDNRAIVYRNLVKIEDRRHFLHASYKIVRKAATEGEPPAPMTAQPLEIIREDAEMVVEASESAQERSTGNSGANTAEQSGLQFHPNHIEISESLNIAPEMFNTVGAQELQSAVFALLKTENSVREIRKKLSSVYPDANVQDALKRADAAAANGGSYADALKQEIETRRTELNNLSSNGNAPINTEEKQRTLDLLELHEAARHVDTDAPNRIATVAKLNEQIAKCAAHRKEDLLRATVTAHEYDQAKERYEQVVAGDQNAAATATEFTDRMYKRAHRGDTRSSTVNAKNLKDAKNEHRAAAEDLERKAGDFSRDVFSFCNAQNERLSFKTHETQVKSQLEAYGLKGNAVFANMTGADYDRIRRVIDQSNPQHIRDSVALVKDEKIAKLVNTPDDFVCVLEMIKMSKDTPLTPAQIITNVNAIRDAKPAHAWKSPLSMAYHFQKHKGDFGTTDCSPTKFFGEYENLIFSREHKFEGSLFGQYGNRREVYYRYLGVSLNKTHVGYCSEGVAQMSNISLEKINGFVSCALLDLREPTLAAVRAYVVRVLSMTELDERADAAVRAAHTAQRHAYILALCKEELARRMEGDIKSYVTELPGGSTLYVEKVLPRVQLLGPLISSLGQEEGQYLGEELDIFRSQFVHRRMQLNEQNLFGSQLADWLKSGEPTKEQWQLVRQWNEVGGRLSSFKDIVWTGVTRSGRLFKLLETARKMNGELTFTEQIREVLRACCSETLTVTDGHLRIEGAVIPISAVLDRIISALPSLHTVSIYAAECVTLDCSLDQPEWSGVNLCIVSRRLRVQKKSSTAGKPSTEERVVIDLSGQSFGAPVKKYASDSYEAGRSGTDAKGGRAGGSSGNLCVLVEELIGGEDLCVRLNGGRGEDGQQGGDGYKARDGAGVDEADVRRLELAKGERASDEKSCSVHDVDGDTYHYKYIDNQGREVLYSAWYGPMSSRFVFMRGGDAENGSYGGYGGYGGAGGYAGTCQIESLTSGRAWTVGEVQRTAGEAGKDGRGGRNGGQGADGNDRYYYTCNGNALPGGSATSKLKWCRRDESFVFSSRPSNYVPLPHIVMPFSSASAYAVFSSTQRKPAEEGTILSSKTDKHNAEARATLQSSASKEEFKEVEQRLGVCAPAQIHQKHREEASQVAETIQQVQRVIERPPRKTKIDILGEAVGNTREDENCFGKKSAYYLGELERVGLMEAAKAMRTLLGGSDPNDRTKALFTRTVHLFLSKEIEADCRFFSQDIDDIEKILPFRERTVEDIVPLIAGLLDVSDEHQNVRKKELERIGKIVLKKETSSKNRELLSLFDDALMKIERKRLRPSQWMAVMCALESKRSLLEQVATGEGKSFIVAAIAAVRCMLDKKTTVDIITSSSLLAERDAKQLHRLYKELGLTVAHNCEERKEAREKAYKARILYGDMQHFQRDYLLHTFYRKNIRGSRRQDCVIVDEVDSMMLDNGNHMLYLSHKVPSLKLLDSLFVFIFGQVCTALEDTEENYSSEKIQLRTLREIFGGISKKDLQLIDPDHADEIFSRLVDDRLIDRKGLFVTSGVWHRATRSLSSFETASIVSDMIRLEAERHKELEVPSHLRDFVRMHVATFIDNCKRAMLMQLDVDYVLDYDRSGATIDDELIVTIIDNDTGVDLASTQWTGGLHQFLQMKHACRVTPISLKAVFISNVNFLRGYKRIDGLSGTLGSIEESKLLADVYKVDLIRIPTNKPRQMIECVPKLCKTKESWLNKLYNEVANIAMASRSTLIICKNIGQLRHVEVEIRKRNASRREKSKCTDKAIDTMTVYKRQHEEMEYEKRALEPRRIILSTNLSGRGTDIRLSSALEKNGGLHVIVAFVPRNKRIEDQAFGRTARSGAPGTARIIAQAQVRADAVVPAELAFKAERDRAEVGRIQALKHHFDFGIDIEESALERFRAAVDRNLFRTDARDERLPEAEDVIYRAMLDDWTLWLDRKAKKIEQCAASRDEEQKKKVITSVDDFLSSHSVEQQSHNLLAQLVESGFFRQREQDGESVLLPLPEESAKILADAIALTKKDAAKEKVVFRVPEWIRAGEWRLRIGIIQASHAYGRADAQETFAKLIEEGGDFAPFACFYAGCMRLQRFEGTREEQMTIRLNKCAEFEADAAGAAEMFTRARVLLGEQLARREAEVRSILLFADKKGASCGLQRQFDELSAAHSQIVANIDWLAGEPLSPGSLREIAKDTEVQNDLFDRLTALGVIAPHLLATRKRQPAGDKKDEKEPLECRELVEHEEGALRRKFQLCLKQARHGLNNVVKAGRLIRGGERLAPHFALPTRLEFWADMSATGGFRTVEHVYVVKDETRKAEVEGILKAPPFEITEDAARFSLLFSNRSLQDVRMYAAESLKDVDSKRIQKLVDDDVLDFDVYASIDLDRLNATHLLQFDGFTAAHLEEHLGMGRATTLWVLESLRARGVLTLKPIEFVTVKSIKRIPSVFTSRCSEIFEVLSHMEGAPSIPLEYLAEALRLTEEEAHKLQAELLQAKVLERRQIAVFRKAGALDCSMLPEPIGDAVQAFLAHHFSYTFALEALEAACYDSIAAPFTLKQVMLATDAHQELYEELRRLEIISPPRITTTHHELIDYDDFSTIDEDELKRFIGVRRSKVSDDDGFLALVPFADVLAASNTELNRETRALMDLGMPVGVSLKEISSLKRGLFAVLNGAARLIRSGVQCFKFIAGCIGMCVGFATDAVVSGVGSYVASKWEEYMPDKAKSALFYVASGAVDCVAWLQEKGGEYLSKAGTCVMDKARAAGKIVPGLETGSYVVQALFSGLKRMYSECRALMGAAQYYQQCQIVVQKIAARSTMCDRVDEFRMLRMFNQMGAAAEDDVEKIGEREQALLDDVRSHATLLGKRMLSDFNDWHPLEKMLVTRQFLKTLDSLRWLEAELQLAVKVACIKTRRGLLQENGILHEYNKKTALRLAYEAVIRDCAQNMDVGKEDEDCLKRHIVDLVDNCLSDLFVSPMDALIRAKVSEHFTIEGA